MLRAWLAVSVPAAVFVALLCTTVVLAVAAAEREASSSTRYEAALRQSLYFESHGRDDIRELPAAVLKGARYIKIDLHFLSDAEDCAGQLNLPYPGQPAMYPNGCFIFIHWFSNLTKTYNSTDDLLAQLQSPTMAQVMARVPDAVDGIVLQLCLKKKPPLPCIGTQPLGSPWATLVDAFYGQATAVVAQLPFKVHFVFDSLQPSESCYFAKWPGWLSTFTDLTQQPFVANPGPRYAEFQMVNQQWNNYPFWNGLGTEGFGRLANSSYPFVAWEPGEEAQIANFQTNVYLAYNVLHTPGMLMAFNADPAMFHTFTAAQTGRYSHQPVGDSGAREPAVGYWEGPGVLVTCARLAGVSAVQCTALVRQANAAFRPIGFDFVGGNTTPVRLSRLDALSVEGGAGDTATVWFTGAGVGMGCRATYQSKAERVTCNCTDARHVAAAGGVASGLSFLSVVPAPATTGGGPAPYLVHVYAPASDPSSLTLSVSEAGAAAPLASGKIAVNVPSGVSDLHVAAATTMESNGSTVTTVAISWSSSRAVFAVIADVSVEASGAGRVWGVVPAVGSNATKVGVGRQPSGIVSADRGTVAFLYGDSFCYNTEMVDDDEPPYFYGQLACNLQDAEFFEFLANPVLAYTHGPAQAVRQRLARGNVHRQGFSTVCDAEVLHGAFDLGVGPRGVLLPKEQARFGDDSVADGEGYFVVGSESLEVGDLLCSCGTPRAFGQRVVVDSFPTIGFYNRTAATAGAR